MNPGKLRHQVTIQSYAPTQNATTGNLTDVWAEFATVWAAVEPLSAREFIAAAASQSKVTAKVIIRYLAGVLPSMRITHGSHVYNIEAVLQDPQSGIEYLTLMVSEVVSG